MQRLAIFLQRLKPLHFLTLAATSLLADNAMAATSDSDDVAILLLFAILIVLIVAVLFIPTIVAFHRQHPNRWLIFVVNIAFGGTIVGWVAALIWALHYVHISKTGNNGGESGINLFANDPVSVRIEPALVSKGAFSRNLAERGADFPSSNHPADGIEGLHRLKALFESGVISADDYTALKTPILKRYIDETE